MFYEIAQVTLTAAAEVIAIAGITLIIAHALYTQHQHFMTEFCPPVAPCPPVVQPEISAVVEIDQPVVDDPWTEPAVEVVTNVVELRPVSRHFNPQLALPAAKEEPKAKTSKPRTKTRRASTKPRTTRTRKTA